MTAENQLNILFLNNMKKIILTGTLFLIAGFVFSQKANTDTTKTTTTNTQSSNSTTTQGSTKLVRKKVIVVPVKRVNDLKQSSGKIETDVKGKKEEETNEPK